MVSERQPPESPPPRDRIAQTLKWVGAVTSILSLIFGLYQAINLVAGVRERQRRVAESLAVEDSQRTAGDFARAWATLQEAAKLADEGGKLATIVGSLDEVRQQVRARQEALGMAWLRDAHPGPGKTFADIVTPVLPVLERGLLTASGPQKADLLAHLGWAVFLQSRDDGRPRNPEARYREAVQLDPENPFAHAHLGHWLLWRNGPLDAGRAEFSAALRSGRARDYVRKMQIAAVQNRRSEEGDGELLAVVNDMRKTAEILDERTRAKVFTLYASSLDRPGATRRRPLNTVPPVEHLETFRALFFDRDFDPSRRSHRDLCLAALQEEAGRPDDALRTLQSLRSELAASPSESVSRMVDARIARLSGSPHRSATGR